MESLKKALGLFLVGLTCLGLVLATNVHTLASPISKTPTFEIIARSPTQIPTVSVSQLPPEARKTIQLIKQGGPFPYRKDGTVFGNREGKLPAAPSGYYREYTVPTPGSPDRGARRIVTGQKGEFYYTKDHYRSFVRVK
ncbi:ribonuclease domain-containing protein [Pantanalinema rosaneae CENA516]|uniref:ribonuclease domain-containing protein n=1 Tax=Pantanalinema rosaneae TaxID=1620701 RepID=UPI003D6F1D66